MNEATKSKAYWGELEQTVLSGKGIDIGCGPDPVSPTARRFDLEDGDANQITQYVKDQFDFVFSSHCLEHMRKPQEALIEWWQLVKPGGFLFFIVPDEDLYEQGVFPSRFNSDHKATFTISKVKSWSPKSYNVLNLANSLPDSEILKLVLNDIGYNRRIARFGPANASILKTFVSAYRRFSPIRMNCMEHIVKKIFGFDQTKGNNVSAQIECIIKKHNHHAAPIFRQQVPFNL
jgi:SAM-dependent methyltransferase